MDIELFRRAVAESRDGITISQVRGLENPLVFVNPAFERMTGYALEEIRGIDCRYLQNADRDQPALASVRHAVAHGEPCLAILRNYRKDGTLFWNELSLSPMRLAGGEVTHFIGIQKDVTARVLAEAQMLDMAMTDALTGINNRRFFDAQLDIQWKIARRAGAPLSLLLIDIDHFKAYNDAYGHPAGDATLQAVARSLNLSFTRSSDFVARLGGEEFAVLSTGMSEAKSAQFAQALCTRIRELRIAHAAAPGGVLTVSVGYAVHRFDPPDPASLLMERADQALYAAKAAGRDRCRGYEPGVSPGRSRR